MNKKNRKRKRKLKNKRYLKLQQQLRTHKLRDSVHFKNVRQQSKNKKITNGTLSKSAVKIEKFQKKLKKTIWEVLEDYFAKFIKTPYQKILAFIVKISIFFKKLKNKIQAKLKKS